jgi:hypothetical protein
VPGLEGDPAALELHARSSSRSIRARSRSSCSSGAHAGHQQPRRGVLPGPEGGERLGRRVAQRAVRQPALRRRGRRDAFCGSGGFTAGKIPVALCTTHEAAHDLFDDPPTYGLPYDDETEMAAVGTIGDEISATSVFDGWGYAHLYRNTAGKIARVDSYAVPRRSRSAIRPDSATCRSTSRRRMRRRTCPTPRTTPRARASSPSATRASGAGGLHRRGRQQLLGRGAVQRAPGDRERLVASRTATTGSTSCGTRARSRPGRRRARTRWCSRARERAITVPLTCSDPNPGTSSRARSSPAGQRHAGHAGRSGGRTRREPASTARTLHVPRQRRLARVQHGAGPHPGRPVREPHRRAARATT